MKILFQGESQKIFHCSPMSQGSLTTTIKSFRFVQRLAYLQTCLQKLKSCAEQTRSVLLITSLQIRLTLLQKHYILLKSLMLLLEPPMIVSLKTFTSFFICKFVTRDMLPFQVVKLEFI